MALGTRTKIGLLATVGVLGLAIGLAVAGWVLYVTYVAQPVRYKGTSMMPTIHDGDRVWLGKRVGEIRRGDVVAFYYPEDPKVSYVKRVIGLPGETVRIAGGVVEVDGAALDEPYVSPSMNRRSTEDRSWTVPAGAFFVLGDNRDASNDSRHYGAIPRGLIWGRQTGGS